MKMSLEAEKFLKKVYAILMLCLTLPGLVGATSINFTLPTESSRVGASETDLIIYQFNLTTNNDATIAGLEPTHGETLTATNPWSGEDVKFYNDSENWNPATDWIGYDTDDDNFYTSYADALVDADEEATLGAGTTSLVGTEVLVQYSTGNGAGPVICVDNLTNPSAVRLDDDGDCTNGTTKEGLYILDGAAVEATAEIEAIAKADFVDNQDGVVETYNITLRADSSGDLNTTSFLLYDGDGSVCFWFDVDDSGALLTDTHATCQGADRSVEITGVVTDGTAEGVAGQVQSTINSDSKFSASVDGAVVSVTTIDAMDLSDAVDINVGGAFSISIIQHGEDEVPADYFTLNGYGDCYIFWFDKLGNDGGAPAVGGCADAVKIDVSSTTTNESVQEAITSAISGHGIFSAEEGASNYITLVTQNFAGVSGNLANTENVANGDFALASFTGGDNTATGIEADTTYYYYRGGASSGDYQSGDELFLNPDFTIAGSIPSSAVAITSTNPWSDVYFFDDGDTFWGAAVDWIGTSDDTTYLDVFEDLMIENTGNATNSDITNVLLYEGADCLGTNVELSYSGGKWGNNTIDWNLSAGLNTYTICADIVGSPTDDATIVIQIAQDDLGLASGTLPTGAGLPATGDITIDTTLPTATPVSIVSDNANSSLAKVGDNVSITFTVSEFVDNVVVTIDTNPADAIVNTGGFNWVAYRVMQTGDTQGAIAFTIDFEDEAGNPATTISSTTDASAVIFDETAPSGYTVSIDQAYINTLNDDQLSFTFDAAEIGATYYYTIESSGGGVPVTGSDIALAVDQQITSVDVSTLEDGILTLTAYLTDPAGNQGANATDTVTKDTDLPEVVNVVPSELAEADVGLVQVDVTFDTAMDQTTALTVSVEGISGGSSALTGDWFNSTVWRGTFTLADNNETVTNAYYAVSGGKDLAGNTMTALSTRGAVNPLNVDTLKPTVQSATAVPDPSGAGEITVTVVFTETMDTATSPTVQILDLSTEPYALIQSTYVGNTWVGTFTLDDDNEEEIARITVSGAKDLAGNTMLADTNAGTFEIDTLVPSGYSVAFVQGYVNSLNEDNITILFSDAEVGADYDYTITSNGGAGELTGSGTIIGEAQEVSIDVSTLADGELTVVLVLTDALANVGNEVNDTITKDTQIPTASDETPTEPVKETATIQVTLSDVGTGLVPASILVHLTDGTTTHLDNVDVDDEHVEFNDGTGVLTITLGVGDEIVLEDGTTTVTINANDLAGNPLEEFQWTFVVDNQDVIINSVEVTPDNMVCALPGEENQNQELHIQVNATDQGLAGVDYVWAFYTDGDILSDFEPDLSGLTTGQFGEEGSEINYVALEYNEENGLWQTTIPMENTTDANFETRTIAILAGDVAGNEFVMWEEDEEEVNPYSVAVFYDFTGPEMDDSCDRNGASTTNFCDILDWSDVEYTFSIEKNANPECNNGGALPWYGVEDYEEGEEGEEEYWMEIFSVTFYGLDFTSPDTWAKLPQLASAIEPYITPPGEFGDSYIKVNSTFFEELDVEADVSFYALPFAVEPTILGDALDEESIEFTANEAFEITVDVCEIDAQEDADALVACYDDCGDDEECNTLCEEEFIGEDNIEDYHTCVLGCGEDDECIIDCVYDTLYDLCSDELGDDQYITYYVPNGELHFTVNGFSQYDITDDQEPVITITSPEDLVYSAGTIPESITFDADGTGSQLSSIQVLLNDDLLFELDYFDIYMGEYCSHETETPDVVTCEFDLPYDEMDDDEYTLTVIAIDFGGEEGNQAEEAVTFVYDTTAPEITIITPTNAQYYYGQSITLQALLIDNLDDDPEFEECILGQTINESSVEYDLQDILEFGEGEIEALGEGEYYILKCYLFDHAENEGSTEVHFVVLEDTEEGTDLIPSEEETEYEFDNETTTAILPYTNVIETIIVPTGVNGTQNLNLSQLIDSDGNARFENGINLSIQRQTSERNYTITIPDGTVVTPGEEWDGLLKLPEVKTSTDYSVDSGRVNIVVEFGNDIQLDFSNPVQIVITGVGSGKRVGWTRGNASLNVITTECNDKDAPTNIPEGGMCYLNVDGNMYIWTYHFTEFGVYTPSSSSSSVLRRDTCITQWICSDWGECANGLQERTCEKEVSSCAIREEMPSLTQSCGQATATPTPLPKDDSLPEIKESVPSQQYEEIVDDNEVEPLPETLPVKPTVKNNTNAVFLGITLFALIAVIVAIALFTKRKKD